MWWVVWWGLVGRTDAVPLVRGIGSTAFANRLEYAIQLFDAPLHYTRTGTGAAVACASHSTTGDADFFLVDDALNWDIDWANHDVDIFPVSMLTISTVVGNALAHQSFTPS